MAIDTKQTKTIGEHHVAAELARRGWAPALTRDGLARTDILAVMTERKDRRLVEIQVKAARGNYMDSISWPLGPKSQESSHHEREYFVMVAIPLDVALPPRTFVLPRSHIAAAAWIAHESWRTDPGITPGKRNATVDRARVLLPVIKKYEDRWELLEMDQVEAPVMLPPEFREYALEARVGLPPGHEWRTKLPVW